MDTSRRLIAVFDKPAAAEEQQATARPKPAPVQAPAPAPAAKEDNPDEDLPF